MILEALSTAYGAAALRRRRWYARDAARRRRLPAPVVSVGNLRVGGTGKTPIVALIARLLLEEGERPAILSRGYARTAPRDGVTVVSDGTSVVAGLDEAGDEPLMLARALPGACVLVGADRFLSGILAERRFGATVHVLDDGFQHHALARDVDLLLVDESDLRDTPMPAGRLREPLAAAGAADAVLVTAADADAAAQVARALGVATSFVVRRALGAPRDAAVVVGARVFACAGIARPERFFEDLRAAGYQVVGSAAFRDHHAFTAADIDDIGRDARMAGASAIVTTEKDMARMPDGSPRGMSLAVVPLSVAVEPADAFHGWLLGRLAARRTPNPEPRTPNPPIPNPQSPIPGASQ